MIDAMILGLDEPRASERNTAIIDARPRGIERLRGPIVSAQSQGGAKRQSSEAQRPRHCAADSSAAAAGSRTVCRPPASGSGHRRGRPAVVRPQPAASRSRSSSLSSSLGTSSRRRRSWWRPLNVADARARRTIPSDFCDDLQRPMPAPSRASRGGVVRRRRPLRRSKRISALQPHCGSSTTVADGADPAHLRSSAMARRLRPGRRSPALITQRRAPD